MVYQGVQVIVPEGMSRDEAKTYLDDQFLSLRSELGDLAQVEILLVGEEVELKAYRKDNIRRVRRITGYLSDQENFNAAKRCELDDRVTHNIA